MHWKILNKKNSATINFRNSTQFKPPFIKFNLMVIKAIEFMEDIKVIIGIIGTFLVTGAGLIFGAGKVFQRMKSNDERIGSVEKDVDELKGDVATMKGQFSQILLNQETMLDFLKDGK